MIFDSWEQGKSFYKAYADHVGFSIRTWTQHKDGDVVKLKKFVCSKEGWRKNNKKENEQVDQKPKRKLKITRVGCKAMSQFKRRSDGKYEVVRFVKTHTHELASPRKWHLLRSNREVSAEPKSALFSCHKALLGTSAAFRLLSVEMGGGEHENIGCTKQDLKKL